MACGIGQPRGPMIPVFFFFFVPELARAIRVDLVTAAADVFVDRSSSPCVRFWAAGIPADGRKKQKLARRVGIFRFRVVDDRRVGLPADVYVMNAAPANSLCAMDPVLRIT